MKKSLFVKYFTVISLFLYTFLPVFSQNIEQNKISRILINRAEDNSYSINLYFDKEYENNAFFQNDNSGLYIYLPDTDINAKKTKILYKNNSDKKNIVLSAEKKIFTVNDTQSDYAIINVNINPEYSISIVPKSSSDDIMFFFMKSIFNVYSLIIFCLGIIIFFIGKKIFSVIENRKIENCYTSLSSDFYKNTIDYKNKFKYDRTEINKFIARQLYSSNIQHADRSSFKCFDIQGSDSRNTKSLDIETVQDRTFAQSNPIKEQDYNTLDMPTVEDIIREDKIPKRDMNGAELLSSINVSNDKGFYLANVENTIALFGFIKNNVFLLKKFKELSQINIQARYYDKTAEGEIYILRLDSYKSMVEFSKDSIRELVVL